MKHFIFVILMIFPFSVFAELPTIEFLYETKSYDEGQVVVVTAVLSAPSDELVSAIIVPDSHSTATLDDHDMLERAEIIITPGQMSGFVSFHILDDGISEAPETLILKLTAPENAKLSTNKTMTITIGDSYEYDLPLLQFDSVYKNASEGSVVEVKATLSAPTTSMVIVSVLVGGDATILVDHNISEMYEIIFYPGETEATFSVSIYQDDIVEPVEMIGLLLSGPVMNARLGSLDSTAIFIYDNSPGMN